MPFTIQQIENMANAALEYHFKGVMAQSLQDRPLYEAMRSKQKFFPGGKDNITGRVKGDYTTAFMGFQGDDTVAYANPTNIKKFSFPWKELHSGIKIEMSELKVDGISVVDSLNGAETSEHDGREMTALANIFEDKIDDMKEGSARSLNNMWWRDGTQDAKEIPGIQYIISTTPTTGVLAGIDRATNSWWRNRASLGITPSGTSQTLIKALRAERRQLVRYGGGKRGFTILCGSDFIEDGLELEITAKGDYTQTGFSRSQNTDVGVADISIRGLGTFKYDPTLDDLGLSKYCYIIDPMHLYPMTMTGEDMKMHTPARPYDKYVIYRAMTYTGALIANKLNCHGVYSIA